ncbi:MAG: acyl-CoA thioesterase [Clostridia bacterium]|nr:acyl-CoA thioesterase [Clostridia bacterium]NCC43827.1 acyl-CoA thioesterase [Clostridia bacterium]
MEEEYQGYEHRVQYYETDQMGCVHHSNYIRWFEEVRTDYLAFLGMDYDRMEAAGILSPVLTIDAEYKNMTRYGETVSIQVRIKEYNGIRIRIGYEVFGKKDGILRCAGESSHCFLNRAGRPVSLKKVHPEWDARLRSEAK